MAPVVRPTLYTAMVLRLLLEAPGPLYGLSIAKEADLRTATTYVVLDRLWKAGWVTREWEEIDPSVEGRPPRRLYQLTDDGAAKALPLVDEVAHQARRITAPPAIGRSAQPRPAPA